jgi:hypothetical protein
MKLLHIVEDTAIIIHGKKSMTGFWRATSSRMSLKTEGKIMRFSPEK